MGSGYYGEAMAIIIPGITIMKVYCTVEIEKNQFFLDLFFVKYLKNCQDHPLCGRCSSMERGSRCVPLNLPGYLRT